MSNAYKCDICNNFYDENSVCSDGYINPRLVESNINCIQLCGCVGRLVEHNSGNRLDICPNCTAKLQKTVNDILREQIKQNNVGVIDGVVDGVEVNYTKS